jgi:hypothetical protein
MIAQNRQSVNNFFENQLSPPLCFMQHETAIINGSDNLVFTNLPGANEVVFKV